LTDSIKFISIFMCVVMLIHISILYIYTCLFSLASLLEMLYQNTRLWYLILVMIYSGERNARQCCWNSTETGSCLPDLTPNGSLKNLGVIFDQSINMYEHVTSVWRAAYYHLKNVHCLKAFLTQEALVTVVHAFVTSRIDYCNSLLYGISDYNINSE
jgi:hypothetical protein